MPTPKKTKPAKPAKTYEALRSFSYTPKRGAAYVDVAEGEHVTGLPTSVVHDLQSNHGDPVLREVTA